MNTIDELIELVDDINHSIEDEWDIQLENKKELINEIRKKRGNDYENFIFSSTKDFKISNSKEKNLILFFDFNDAYLKNNVESVGKYVNSALDQIITHIEDQVNSEKDFCIYFLNNHHGKTIQVQQYNNLNDAKSVDSWSKFIIDKLNEKRNKENKISRSSTNKVKVAFNSYNIYKKKKIMEVKINSRVKSATVEDLKDRYTSAEVYSASLYSLVTLFGDIGNDLFKDNLRFKVSDKPNTVNVDKEIQHTLKKYPQEFWYLNNGISLLVDENLLSLNHSEHLTFTLDDEILRSGNYNLSVINGAQTLNAAAEYFFNIKAHKADGVIENDATKNKEIQKMKTDNLKEALENAFVILRVIKVSGENSDKVTSKYDWINKVAIALNSQKPIMKEDLVSTTYFIEAINKINQMEKENAFSFAIIKRGEQSSTLKRKYKITDLAKILVTYLEFAPSKAKNSTLGVIGTKKIEEDMKFTSEAFKEQSILIDSDKKFEDRVIEYKEKAFDIYYKPVNFLMSLNNSLDKLSSNESLPEFTEKVKNYFHAKRSPTLKGLDAKVKGILTFGKYHLILAIYKTILEDNKNENWDKTSNDATLLFVDDTIIQMCLSFIYAWDETYDLQDSYAYTLKDFRIPVAKEKDERYTTLIKSFKKYYNKFYA
ncbi:AIPR family protein [Exiguobacterium sp. s78]|uniref:AIPR family protein n=1 Tax=Exiguobacterium sp. s78 TaxID=2751197 RepID=UPI001BECA7D7|nr:AIPR family protein [Exiguobacterium sp. s78]